MYEFPAPALRSRNRPNLEWLASFIDSKAHMGLNLQKSNAAAMHKNAQKRTKTPGARRPSTEPRASATGLAVPSAAPQKSSRRAKTLTDRSTTGKCPP
jgi:hypothetical protein